MQPNAKQVTAKPRAFVVFVSFVPFLFGTWQIHEIYQLTNSDRWKAELAAVDQALQNFRVVHEKASLGGGSVVFSHRLS